MDVIPLFNVAEIEIERAEKEGKMKKKKRLNVSISCIILNWWRNWIFFAALSSSWKNYIVAWAHWNGVKKEEEETLSEKP